MNEANGAERKSADELLALYDDALDDVYGYLIRRCGSASTAEDLTSETFIAAVDAVQQSRTSPITVAWLIGVARNKLVDHWRRTERNQRLLTAIDGNTIGSSDEWDVVLDVMLASQVLAALAPQHQAALTLRHLDGLPVAEVAEHLGRTYGATEVLLVRARQAFRQAYETQTERKGER